MVLTILPFVNNNFVATCRNSVAKQMSAVEVQRNRCMNNHLARRLSCTQFRSCAQLASVESCTQAEVCSYPKHPELLRRGNRSDINNHIDKNIETRALKASLVVSDVA
jgi:hypothetical protein